MTEILHAGRTVTDDVIAYDISWDGDLATTGTVVWSMQVTSEDAAETLQLAYEVVDGAFSAQFALDLASGRWTDVDEDATLEAHDHRPLPGRHRRRRRPMAVLEGGHQRRRR